MAETGHFPASHWPWGTGWEFPTVISFMKITIVWWQICPWVQCTWRTQQCFLPKHHKTSTFKLQEKLLPHQPPWGRIPNSLIPRLPCGVMEHDTSSPEDTDPLAEDTTHGQECSKGLLIHNWGLWRKQGKPLQQSWNGLRESKERYGDCFFKLRLGVG